ncbi:MAG: YhbY family RNA-binding protein [Nanoarchaeota archaeon]|nr:YhbY family RNA-binding protein [Nanoarchaeota archaeon]MBU1704226.1 YhbY family RNA-binding protein [Nanoarchaeota archaeon]
MNTQSIIKQKAKALEPTVRVGKAGLTEKLIQEIISQLKKKKTIKVKLVKGALEGSDKKKLAKELAEKTGAELIDQVGFVVVLNKKT